MWLAINVSGSMYPGVGGKLDHTLAVSISSVGGGEILFHLRAFYTRCFHSRPTNQPYGEGLLGQYISINGSAAIDSTGVNSWRGGKGQAVRISCRNDQPLRENTRAVSVPKAAGVGSTTVMLVVGSAITAINEKFISLWANGVSAGPPRPSQATPAEDTSNSDAVETNLTPSLLSAGDHSR